jgi:serine/threonine protein kinase
MSSINLCIAIKKSGQVCNKPSKFIFDDKYYCGIHYKKIQKNSNVVIDIIPTIPNIPTIPKVQPLIDNDEFNNITNIIEDNVDLKIIKCIKKNKYTNIFLANDILDNKQYVIKLAYHKKNNNSLILRKHRDLLFWEHMILSKHFSDHTNVVKLYNKKSYLSIKNDEYYIILSILEYCYETLYDRTIRLNFDFTIEQIKNYGIQLVKTSKDLHNKGYIYIDFNLTNLMFKTGESEEVTFIDFRICEKYIDIEGIPKEQKTFMHTIGTDMFSSINCNNCKSSDRIGDIQSIGYILLYLCNKGLPWKNKKNIKSIFNNKKNLINTTIFINSPEFIKEFIIESYNDQYEFSDKPYYNNFITILS